MKIDTPDEINIYLKSLLNKLTTSKGSDWDQFKKFPNIPQYIKWEAFKKYALFEAKKHNKFISVNRSDRENEIYTSTKKDVTQAKQVSFVADKIEDSIK